MDTHNSKYRRYVESVPQADLPPIFNNAGSRFTDSGPSFTGGNWQERCAGGLYDTTEAASTHLSGEDLDHTYHSRFDAANMQNGGPTATAHCPLTSMNSNATYTQANMRQSMIDSQTGTKQRVYNDAKGAEYYIMPGSFWLGAPPQMTARNDFFSSQYGNVAELTKGDVSCETTNTAVRSEDLGTSEVSGSIACDTSDNHVGGRDRDFPSLVGRHAPKPRASNAKPLVSIINVNGSLACDSCKSRKIICSSGVRGDGVRMNCFSCRRRKVGCAIKKGHWITDMKQLRSDQSLHKDIIKWTSLPSRASDQQAHDSAIKAAARPRELPPSDINSQQPDTRALNGMSQNSFDNPTMGWSPVSREFDIGICEAMKPSATEAYWPYMPEGYCYEFGGVQGSQLPVDQNDLGFE